MAEYIEKLKNHFNVTDVSLDTLNVTLNGSFTKIQALKEFCKLVGIKKYSKLKKPELVDIIIQNMPQQEPLSAFNVSTSDDESESESESENEMNDVVTRVGDVEMLHFAEAKFDEYIRSAKVVAVMYCSEDCDPCMKLKPKFMKLALEYTSTVDVQFGIVNIEEYERNISEIPEEVVDEIPAIHIYKNNEIAKTLVSPTVSVIRKNIDKLLVEKVSVKELKQICVQRGLLQSGKKDDILARIKEDDDIAQEIGYHLHTRNEEQLIEYLENDLKMKSAKHTTMTCIELMKKIRKGIQTRKYKNEENYEVLLTRVATLENHSDIIKTLKKMTLKQLKIMIDHDYHKTISDSADIVYTRMRDAETGEMIKALSKNQIINKLEGLFEE